MTPDNFIHILKGEKDKVKGGNGKVLNSTKDDNVFIYFADHGAKGLIAFPHTYLYADTLNDAFRYMYDNGLYK